MGMYCVSVSGCPPLSPPFPSFLFSVFQLYNEHVCTCTVYSICCYDTLQCTVYMYMYTCTILELHVQYVLESIVHTCTCMRYYYCALGMGGSGRQSAAKLATFMASYDLFQIEITKNYTTVEWREDLKKVQHY